jgi:NitT/TauT family transport system ATP-binding protein
MGARGGSAISVAVPEHGTDDALLSVDGVSRHFGKEGETLVALSEVSMQIHKGQFVSLVGPSGCGKSTLLRIMAGLTEPSAGRVYFAGQQVKQPSPDVSLMLQTPTLMPWRTALANTLLPVELRGKVTPEHVSRAEHLLDLVGLNEFTNHYPKQLSGGMQQRVALSRVLVTDPQLLLLDEPFGALDEFTRERLNVELAALCARSGRTVVLVTHSINEAVFLADRIVAMGTKPGRVVGTVDVPLERPRDPKVMYSAEFLEVAAEVKDMLLSEGGTR